jgi:hypothetical protein
VAGEKMELAAVRNSKYFTYNMGKDNDLKGLFNYLKNLRALGFVIDGISVFDYGYLGGYGQEYNEKELLMLPDALYDAQSIGDLMEKNGVVHMMGCYVGENPDVLQLYANAFKRRVTGSSASTDIGRVSRLLNWYRSWFTVRERSPD